jgi:epoxide hydrolase-like predicted phosphatase
LAAAETRAGLLVDFGGVLTTDVFASFAAFCAVEGLAPGAVRDAFRGEPVARELLFDLECGRISEEDFAARFGALLGVADHTGLIGRLFAGIAVDARMVDAVTAAHAAGVRTGLVSNSWGRSSGYDRELFARIFDGLVISAEEGMRKPDPAIYRLGAERIGLPPTARVFVDDLPGNLKPAAALGMATVHHVDAAQTVAELETLLGVTLG